MKKAIPINTKIPPIPTIIDDMLPFNPKASDDVEIKAPIPASNNPIPILLDFCLVMAITMCLTYIVFFAFQHGPRTLVLKTIESAMIPMFRVKRCYFPNSNKFYKGKVRKY